MTQAVIKAMRPELFTRGTGRMRAYLQISGVIFGIIGVLHVVRLLFDWPAEVSGWAVPLWISWMAILAAATLSFWAFHLLSRAGPSR